MVKHIAFTLYPVKDVARARKFYEEDLGLKLTKSFQDAWIEYHLENGCFAITSMADDIEPSASAGGSISFEVDDVDRLVAQLSARGVSVKVPPFSTPVCRMAYVLDTEGNVVGLHQKTKK